MLTEEQAIELLPEDKKLGVKFLLQFKPSDLPENPQRDTWYTYRPSGAISSDGTPYHSTLKIGKENKLLVMFCGGGCAYDAYAAARPGTFAPVEGEETFYAPNTYVVGYMLGHGGLANKDIINNPFKDWSVVVINYANGDFHCGTNDFEYNDAELGKGVCFHRGYLNYRAMVEKIKEFIPDPEQVMVTGYSAGGFGAALLTDDIIGLFDKCSNFICLPDSSVLMKDDWQSVAKNQWGAPKAICDRIKNNITVDCLLDLHKKHGDKVKILFDCTYRDALLAKAQSYIDGKGMVFSKEGGDVFQANLKTSVETLCKEISNIAVYIFDKPSSEKDVDTTLTEHTLVEFEWLFDYSYNGVKFIDWVNSAINGKPMKIGLELLDRNKK